MCIGALCIYASPKKVNIFKSYHRYIMRSRVQTAPTLYIELIISITSARARRALIDYNNTTKFCDVDRRHKTIHSSKLRRIYLIPIIIIG